MSYEAVEKTSIAGRRRRRWYAIVLMVMCMSVAVGQSVVDVIQIAVKEAEKLNRWIAIKKLAGIPAYSSNREVANIWFDSVSRRFSTPLMNDSDARRIYLDLAPPSILHETCAAIERLGSRADGGWNACFKSEQEPENCTVYSFGVADNWSFDAAIAARGCTVHAFDPTIGRETGDDLGPKIKFYNLGLGTRILQDPEGRTRVMDLRSIMKMLGHEVVHYLKFDIDGSEWEVLQQWFQDGIIGPGICPPFLQVMTELHFGNVIWHQKRVAILKNLRDAGFHVFSRLENWRFCDHGNIKAENLNPGIQGYRCIEAGLFFSDRGHRACGALHAQPTT